MSKKDVGESSRINTIESKTGNHIKKSSQNTNFSHNSNKSASNLSSMLKTTNTFAYEQNQLEGML
jgi:hypothetical protein